jgi:hypothetical protein
MFKYARLEIMPETAWVAPPGAAFMRVARVSDFDVTPEPGMLYVTTRAISSRVNANWDGWPPDELRGAYRTFIGKPVFVDHRNHDPKRTRGVIVGSRLLDGKLASGHDDVAVELLIEVDARAFPRLAAAIMSGRINSVSMGADVEFTICSACDNKATKPSEYCKHIPAMKGRVVPAEGKIASERKSVRVWENCHGVHFFEISFVFDPADESALISDKILFEDTMPRAASRIASRIRHLGESVESYQERRSALSRTASRHTAEDGPERVVLTLPDDVDTLRSDSICPVCMSPFDGVKCERCGFEQPPEGLEAPDTSSQGVQMPVAPEGQGGPANGEGGPPKKKSEPKSKGKSEPKAKSKKKEGGMSKFDEVVAGARTAEGLPVTYDQSTAPADNVPQYGQGAGPDGQVTPPPEAPFATSDGEMMQPAKEDPQTLDQSVVQHGPDQSEVSVVTSPGTDPQGKMSAKEALLQRAAYHRQIALNLTREADAVEHTDVQELDQPAPIDVGPDAQADVNAPTDESEQLQRADSPGAVNDGTGTGHPVPPPGGYSEFNTVGPYAAGVDPEVVRRIASAASARTLRVAELVGDRIALGIAAPERRLAEIGEFEQMSDEVLEGYSRATQELKDAKHAVAGGRIRVKASAGGGVPLAMPSPGPRRASGQEALEDRAIAAAAFV